VSASASAAPAGSASAKPRRQRPPTDNTNKVVWVMRGPKPVPVAVKVGLTDGSFTEIVSGDVQEGDAVVLEVMSGDDGSNAPKSAPGGAQPPRMRL
jgi:HlyD family secretion protein